MKYCVYPSPVSQPTDHHVLATGANGAQWVFAKGSNNFAFVRPGGNKTNIPLDGNTTTMGDATWSKLPDSQKIILHINDPTTCASLYGAGTPGTCFVKPSPLPPQGPICDKGDTSVAYNAMPFDVVNCLNPGVGFEANGWNEFGDSVVLKTGTGRTLSSLKVDFQSFACETSGHWDGVTHDGLNTPSPCLTANPGASFTHPITANIYDPSQLTTPIATVTVVQTIPYRPSADSTGHCTGTEANKWWNPQGPGGGACQNSIATVLTFNNFTAPAGGPVGSLPNDVVWTVAFDTTSSGYSPLGTTACSTAVALDPLQPGCPYDSLNVGDKTYPAPAPYAGTSLFDTNGGLAVGSKGQPSSGLGFYTPDDAGRPLGEIITS
jgi:hypothetical protein